MKKKQKEINPEKQIHKDLEYLERKLGEEKQNLVRENKKLQKQIHQQIQQNRLMRATFDKQEQSYQFTIQQLRIENERLKTQILSLQQSRQNQYQFEVELRQAHQSCKLFAEQNKQLKDKLQQYIELIGKMEEDINTLQKQNNKLKRKLKDDEQEIKNLAKQIDNNKDLYKSLQVESEKTIQELQRTIEENQKLDNNLNIMKKKNKQFNSMIKDMEQKLEQIQHKQQQDFERKTNQIKREKEQLQHLSMERERQIEFLRISDSQKTQYIETLTKEIMDVKNINELSLKQNTILTGNLQRVENENRRLQIELEKQKSKWSKQIEELEKIHQQQVIKVKKKTAEQVGALIKNGNQPKVVFENYMQGLKSHKSQMNLRGGIFLQSGKAQEKTSAPFEKLKYEHEILNLESEIQNLKKQIQTSQQQNQRLKKYVQQLKQEIEQKSSKIKQVRLELEKNEIDKRVQQQKLYKQISQLRNIETELLQTRKKYVQTQQAANYKVSYYDKKLREEKDMNDRRQKIIENMQIQRTELENKVKFMQEKLVRSIEETQSLRKFKNDTNRKQELLKEYREKIEKMKSQYQAVKNENEKFRKEKNRLERNLESKQEYINTLRLKNQKQQMERQHQVKQKQEKNSVAIKEKYETKLKKMRKQLEQFQLIIDSMRSVIAEKIEEAIKKSQVSSELTTQKTNWQAAALLGLKSDEIQQFINPGMSIDRNICEDLDQLWQKRKYQQFIRSSIQYLLLKHEVQPLS